jgi:hypothetical protein
MKSIRLRVYAGASAAFTTAMVVFFAHAESPKITPNRLVRNPV